MKDPRRRSGDSPWRPQRPYHRRGAGDWVLRHRQTTGIPQAVLAERLSISIRRLSRLERGLDPIPARLIATVVTMLTADQSSTTMRRRSRHLTPWLFETADVKVTVANLP